MATAATITAVAALASAAASGYGAYESTREAEKARHDQKKAQEEATAKQKEADVKAEQERLSALAEEQTRTDYASAWNIDSTLANKYADAAQKLQAGTGGGLKQQDEEDNPFYTRGLF